jgi:hypothetical protein
MSMKDGSAVIGTATMLNVKHDERCHFDLTILAAA